MESGLIQYNQLIHPFEYCVTYLFHFCLGLCLLLLELQLLLDLVLFCLNLLLLLSDLALELLSHAC